MANEIMRAESRALAEGSKLTALQEQVLRTVPGAKDAPLPVIMGACMMAWSLNLSIQSGEVYIGTFGRAKDERGNWVETYSYGLGIKGARVLADRESRHQISLRDLSEDECKRLRGEDWDPADIGVEATCIRYDDARMAQQIGMEYVPRKAYGFWRKKARYNGFKKEWVSDQIPNTWTAHDVAEKRAEKNVLTKAFTFSKSVDSVRILDPIVEGGAAMLEDGGYVDVESGAAAQMAQRMLDDTKRTMSEGITDGVIDEDGYIVETKAERMRRERKPITDEAAAAEIERRAQEPDIEAPVETLDLDWSSGAWDVMLEDIGNGKWDPPDTGNLGKLYAKMAGAGDEPNEADYAQAISAMDAVLGAGGTLVVFTRILGEFGPKVTPASVCRYIGHMASGKNANALAVVTKFAKNLQDLQFGNPDEIPF